MQITIAICTYRRFDWLRKCLTALERQSLPSTDFKIIVVDNSLQPEKSEKSKAAFSGFTNLEYLITDKAGLSYSRNVALKECETPYIAYIDDDALAGFYWVQSVLHCFERYKGSVGIVGGPVRPIWEIPKPDWLEGRLYEPLAIVDWAGKEFVISRDDKSKWLVGANISYVVEGLRKIGGFPENLGRREELLLCHEELAVNDALCDMGYKMVYCPDALVEHLVQKERISARWLCIDAFWEAVSYAIYASGESDGNMTSQARKSLEFALNDQLEGFTVNENQEDIEKERDRFRKAALLAIDQYKYIPKKPGNVAPCVYIVTPCLNARQFIDICIDSVISQAGDFYIRYHIQDGGSDDGTIQKLSAWKDRIDSGHYQMFCRGNFYGCNRE